MCLKFTLEKALKISYGIGPTNPMKMHYGLLSTEERKLVSQGETLNSLEQGKMNQKDKKVLHLHIYIVCCAAV